MKLVYVHGWGLHAGIWDPLTRLLAGHEHILVDLGFVRGGPKGVSEIPADAVCIGHSFGVLWLLKHGPRPMKGLVSIAGFDCFHRHAPSTVIPAMQEGLRRDAPAQMRQFYAMCGMTEGAPERGFDKGALRAGLDWLAAWDEKAALDNLEAPKLALASEDDRIVRKPMTEAVWGSGSADLHWTGKGGHILPVTQAEWCAEQIKGFIDDIDL
jgi:pimeloyl-[acyl-carrier protein] methyl ester esterase